MVHGLLTEAQQIAVVGLARRQPGTNTTDVAETGVAAAGAATVEVDATRVDAEFFGAEGMDPRERLVLEVGWEALERAGIAPWGLDRSRVVEFADSSPLAAAGLAVWRSRVFARVSRISPWRQSNGPMRAARSSYSSASPTPNATAIGCLP
ncbi:beta-ketoacyl synthase N-terminal-like domain-containing protein [Kribbella qitaiheensis]|nr:beta-ketoacyl synthase N-terminal-like domain-containing protein [Kribbella qitaiheensis]